MNKTLLNAVIDQAILQGIRVEITFQSSKNKISTLSTELRELFKHQNKWLVLTTSGMPIELKKVIAVVLLTH
jgi:hypothetical protein